MAVNNVSFVSSLSERLHIIQPNWKSSQFRNILLGKFERANVRNTQTEKNNIPSNLLENVQYELIEDLIDAHGQGLVVYAFAEVTHSHQFNQLPGGQAVLRVLVLLVVCKVLFTPSGPRGLRELSQEVLDLRRYVNALLEP